MKNGGGLIYNPESENCVRNVNDLSTVCGLPQVSCGSRQFYLSQGLLCPRCSLFGVLFRILGSHFSGHLGSRRKRGNCAPWRGARLKTWTAVGTHASPSPPWSQSTIHSQEHPQSILSLCPIPLSPFPSKSPRTLSCLSLASVRPKGASFLASVLFCWLW